MALLEDCSKLPFSQFTGSLHLENIWSIRCATWTGSMVPSPKAMGVGIVVLASFVDPSYSSDSERKRHIQQFQGVVKSFW